MRKREKQIAIEEELSNNRADSIMEQVYLEVNGLPRTNSNA